MELDALSTGAALGREARGGSRRQPEGVRRSPALVALTLLDSGLLLTSGVIHLQLAETAYRHVRTLDKLFVVQFVACAVVTAVLWLWPRLIVLGAGIALTVGTVVGYVLARTSGIFGFTLPYPTPLGNAALIVELIGTGSLALTAWMLWRRL